MAQESYTQTFSIPGTTHTLQMTRAASGQLLRLVGNGRVYLEARADGRHFDEGLAVVSERLIGRTLLRHVRTASDNWLERYRWDADERLSEVDGVRITRDAARRVIACDAESGATWRYCYGEDGPVRIITPTTQRTLAWQQGRLVRVTEPRHQRTLRYRDDIRHDTVALPATWQRDDLGRVWAITAADGRVLTTFLWDGYACLARIDGPVGAPLAALYSLDPTCTPVRIITRHGVTRIPRDAFGEGLLEHPTNPGLYGGMVWHGLTHLPARTLDPRTGTFTSPDPYHGLEADPRRAMGYRGPLPTEHHQVNRYAISRYDPIGRADPTGNLSWWVYLSDFTWSLGNNLVGWFGLDWTINFFGSLFTGQIGDFFDYESLSSSDRLKLTGVRRDGLTAPGRAWTFQHLVMVPHDELHVLAQARVIDPQQSFRPTLYGTVLHAAPAGHRPLLLHGTLFPGVTNWPNGPANWSRAGGPAEPVIPGAPIPIFPQGGLHLDSIITRIPEPTAISLRELEARDRSVLGRIGLRTVIVMNATGTGLAVDQNVLLSDAANNRGIFRLLSVSTPNGTTRVRVDSEHTGVGPTDVRLRQLDPPDPSEALAQTTEPTHLETQGSARAYRPGDALRLRQGGSVVGAGLITRLEARLALDAAAPDPFSQPILILNAPVAGGTIAVTRAAIATSIEYPVGATLPAVGATLVVRGNGNEVPIVVQAVAGQTVQTDRDLASTGASGATVQIQALARGSELGRRTADREAAAHITYTPPAVRSAPTSGFVRLEDNDGRVVVRRITSRVFDALVFDQPLPGNPATPYEVERFPVRGFDRAGLTITTEQVLALEEPVNIGTPPALLLQQFNGSTLATLATGVASAAWTNGTSFVSQQFTAATNPPAGFGPAQALVVDGGSTREVRRIRTIEATVTLDREVLVSAGATTLRVVRLNTTNMPRYQGRVVGPLQLTVPGHGLAVGNEVTVDFAPGVASVTNQYRVAQIGTGNTLTLDGGQRHAVAVTPAGGTTTAGTVGTSVTVALLPMIGAQPVQMPRWLAEATVAVTWDNVGVPLRVVAVASDLVTVTHRAAVDNVHDLYLKTVTCQQMVPVDPATGTAWAGIHGRAVGGTAVGDQERTTRLAFTVWAPNGLPKDVTLAVADGARTIPCRTLASANLDVRITLDRDLTTSAATLTLHAPTPAQTGFALDFVQEDRAIVIRDEPALMGVTGTNLVLVSPMVPAPEAERLATSAHIGPGTVLVPQDPEHWELDRRQSLIDHELIHTRQSAAWGPLLLAWFPLFIEEGLLELATNIEKPTYSPYVVAELATSGGARVLRIPNPGETPFAREDRVQVAHDGTVQTIRLGSESSAGSREFSVTELNGLRDQPVRVRKVLNFADTNGFWMTLLPNTADEARDFIFNFQQILTHGGILNLLTGSVYGGLFHGIGRLFYALGRAIFGKGDRYAATVGAERTSLTLDDEAAVTALSGANRIIVQKMVDGTEQTVVRSLSTPASGNSLTLTAALEPAFTGSVQVAPYSTHTPDSAWDWHRYYPAQVPNAAEPAAIQLFASNGGAPPTLKVFDRVVVTSGANSQRTNVTHVRGDGIIELEDAPATSGTQREFRIAKIDEGDPLGNADSAALQELGFGWMRWLFDPYGQFQYRLQPANDSFGGIVARIARYLFGTTSWSLIFPFGYYFWDNAFVQSSDNGHFSQMEQEASAESGDLYSPIGRLRGAFTLDKETKRYRGVVGDIGRYWYFHVRRTDTLVTAGHRDAPGVHWEEGNDGLRVVPDWTGGGPTTGVPDQDAPNQDAQAGGDTPGLAVPDHYFRKAATAPLATTAAGPTGFAPAVAGYVPVSPRLERSFGMYVSFCRAGQHRVTVPNGVTSAVDALEAQEGDSTFGFGRQTIFFNVDVADVAVTVAGQAVAATLTDDGAGNFLPGTLELVQLQRARISVTPNGVRRYAITVPYAGRGGQLLTDGTSELVALNRNTPANEPEAVEISRVYRRGADGNYDDAVLNAHRGVHLTGDLHIPVRWFRVRVVNTLPVRRAVTLEAGDILDPATVAGKLRPGDTAYVIIPAEPVSTLRLDSVTYPVPPALVTNPDPPRIDPEPTPAALQAFVGDGVISRITLQADNPPETTARVRLLVRVGHADLRADLTAEMEVIPHLTLAPLAGVTVQNNGATLVFAARDEGGAAVNVKLDSIRLLELDGTTAAGLSATVTNDQVTITASSAATVGRKQILVEKESAEGHWARRTFEVIA